MILYMFKNNLKNVLFNKIDMALIQSILNLES
jgi:hypothetical protein